ncbi:MAG: AtpZ/AtpI family protein [Deltaproteobacteria bacterium]|nr:AtpZ/AtpI family protein [Deltaproteobacteria bacterium]MCW5802039.1 AtpZ/AtpI family protein [Deltaproteobacteria bacterium]
MSQGARSDTTHPSGVTTHGLKREVVVIDPIAQKTKRAFQGLQDSAVGLEFGVSVVIALAFGVWLDGQAGTDPWFMFVFLGIGLAAGFRSILRAVRRADKAAAHG